MPKLQSAWKSEQTSYKNVNNELVLTIPQNRGSIIRPYSALLREANLAKLQQTCRKNQPFGDFRAPD